MEAVMKRNFVIVLAIGVFLAFSPSSQAAVKVFKNCTELNKVHPGGVARPGAVNKGGTTKLTPKYDKKLYEANKKSDRDKDGIACEK
jgi:hypothetical protein